MLKNVVRIIGIGMLGLAIVVTTVLITKSVSEEYTVELAGKKKGPDVDEDADGVELLRFDDKGEK